MGEHADDMAFLAVLRKLTLRQLERLEARWPRAQRRGWKFAALRVATLRVLRSGKSARPGADGHASAPPTT